MAWENEDIVVSSKILGHISSGIYRSASGAIKELVSNAFDANATRVAITTNWPSFDIMACRDNGSGMALEKFHQIMTGGIGDSTKRVYQTGDTFDETPGLNRPIIGWLGIGMLGVAQVCHEFKVISHHRDTQTAFEATIRLMDHMREKVSQIDQDESSEKAVDVGKFSLKEIEYNIKEAGTYVIASDMRSAFVAKFRENSGKVPLPSKFSSFLDTVHRKPFKELGDYWKMIWDLAISCPIPYFEESLFDWKQIEVEQTSQRQLQDLMQTLRDYEFEVVVDGLSLRKPNIFPYPKKRRNSDEPLTGRLFSIDTEAQVHGQPFKLFGYVYLQDGQAVEPAELRGLLVRIRNIAIGSYDVTCFNYPSIQGPRFYWLSGEIYVQAGVEFALNIDRDSFNEMHPHYVRLQKVVHDLLKTIFAEAERGQKNRSRKKKQNKQKEQRQSLNQLIKKDLGESYSLIVWQKEKDLAVDDRRFSPPVVINPSQQEIILNDQSKLLPQQQRKRELVTAIAYAFETAMLAPEEERRKKFYEILLDLVKTDLL